MPLVPRAPALVSLLLLAAALSLPCPRTLATRRPAAAPDYFPLAVGNSWTYRAGSPHVDLPEQHFTTTVAAARRDRAVWFLLRDYQGGDHWVRRTAGRVVEAPARLWYRFDLPVGGSWTMRIAGGLPGSDGARLTLAARNETVETPAGTFRGCLRIDYRHRVADAGVISEWFAPGVGLVKRSESRIFGEWITLLEQARVNGREYPARAR